MDWKSLIAAVLLTWYIILLGIGLLGLREARKRYAVKPRSPLATADADTVPGVSVLRPLKGLDPNMYENLETTFRQVYPKYEVLFAVADEDDPALRVVRNLMGRYPSVDASIIIGEEVVGVNPKVNNLMKSYRAAKYDILWVLDSNVQVIPDALARSVDVLTQPPKSPKHKPIGLVHHVPFAITNPSIQNEMFGTRTERAFLNTNHAKMYIALNVLAVDSCVMGKSNMYRKSDVEKLTGTGKPHSTVPENQIRGLAAFGKYLAEDAMIGSAIWHELGLRHSLAYDVAGNALGSMPLSAYVLRRTRWIRVRKRVVFAATMLEPFTESVFVGILASWSIGRLSEGRIPPWLFFCLNTLVFLSVDLSVRELVTGGRMENQTLKFVLEWLGREWLAFPIWCLAVLGNEVEWRGSRYMMMKNGETAKVDENAPRGWRRRTLQAASRLLRPARSGYWRVATEAY